MEHKRVIAFQGVRGAYSEQAIQERAPGAEVLPCKSFEEVFAAVEGGEAELGMLPVENSTAGVVSDSYDLLAVHHLQVVGEHYLRVRHCLLGMPGARLEEIRTVFSHPQALAQCRGYLRDHGWAVKPYYDTAGAAADLLVRGETSVAAIASELCVPLYGLQVLARDIQEQDLNTTRFLLVAREEYVCDPGQGRCKTSLLFEVRDIPAALYKCLGGFATNGVNLTRLESRPVKGGRWVYHFYLDFQGRPDQEQCRLALEELQFYTTNLKILGCYPEADQPQ